MKAACDACESQISKMMCPPSGLSAPASLSGPAGQAPAGRRIDAEQSVDLHVALLGDAGTPR
jgi:hypothetical protein